MTRAINYTGLLYIAFCFTNDALSLLDAPAILSPLPFLLPLLLFLTPAFRKCEKQELGLDFKAALPFLPIFFVFLSCIFITSVVSTFAFSVIGYESTPVTPESDAVSAIIFSIIIPSVCEELFCRYAVLRLLAPYGKSGAVVLSALLFALLHRNFYQMPYAFVAGLFLGAVTLASGGIACAIIFHILNNSLSTILYYSSDGVNAAVYIACFICAILYAAICSHSSSPARILSLRDASVKPMLLHSCVSLAALFALYALLVSI